MLFRLHFMNLTRKVDLCFFSTSGTGEKLRKSIFGVKMSELNIINLIKQETYLVIFYSRGVGKCFYKL